MEIKQNLKPFIFFLKGRRPHTMINILRYYTEQYLTLYNFGALLKLLRLGNAPAA